MTLLQLFLAFVQVGMFAIGGGYAAVPLIKSQAVDGFGWLTVSEFTDLLTIAEMTPGPIVVNSATFVGIRVAGIPGAVIATLGSVLPSLFLVTAMAMIYRKYRRLDAMQTVLSTLRPAVAAMIASAFVTILLNVIFVNGVQAEGVDWLALALFAAALAVIRIWKKNVILVMVGCGVIYTAVNLLLPMG